MKRKVLILCMAAFLTLYLFGTRNGYAGLIKQNFYVNIIDAEDDNPFGVIPGEIYLGASATYDDDEVLAVGSSEIIIGPETGYLLNVTIGSGSGTVTRTFTESEDVDYYTYSYDENGNLVQEPGTRPTLYFEDGIWVGMDFHVYGLDGYELDAFWQPLYNLSDFSIYEILFDEYGDPKLDENGDPLRGTEFVYGDFTPVPEPATMLLLGTGLAGLAALRRRFRKT